MASNIRQNKWFDFRLWINVHHHYLTFWIRFALNYNGIIGFGRRQTTISKLHRQGLVSKRMNKILNKNICVFIIVLFHNQRCYVTLCNEKIQILDCSKLTLFNLCFISIASKTQAAERFSRFSSLFLKPFQT